MAFDRESVIRWIGITLAVLLVGYLLFRVGKVIMSSVGAFRKVYQTSMAPPGPAGFTTYRVDPRQFGTS